MRDELINVIQQQECINQTDNISPVFWTHLEAQSINIKPVLIRLITQSINKMKNNTENSVIFYTNGVYDNILWGVNNGARNQIYGGLRYTGGELRFEFNLVNRYYGSFIDKLIDDEHVQSNNDGSNWSHFVITDEDIGNLENLMADWFNQQN